MTQVTEKQKTVKKKFTYPFVFLSKLTRNSTFFLLIACVFLLLLYCIGNYQGFVDETQLSGIKYLLVCESEDENEEESAAYILKEITEEGAESIYEFVEDDVELEAVAKLFDELVGDDADVEV